ncbi:MAG: polysaccharide lyase family 8 super-sandwich domain-containing protein, partial [Rikenellaceae bacterium]
CMRILNSTSYDFTQDQKVDMRNYMLNGITTSVWRGAMDVSSCGRQLFINTIYGKGASLLISCLNMMHVDPEQRDAYENYISRNFIAPHTNNLMGNIQFDISKYTIHRAQEFMFSIRMCSTSIIGGETTNNENLKGYHMADGATMIYVDGDEYHDIFAIWDSKYIPGTTVALNNKPLKTFKDYTYYNGSDFVGGASDGMYGVSAMEYRRDGVSADKSWFFFDDLVVCLGSSISSQEDKQLVTTLNQNHFKGSTNYMDNSGEINSNVLSGEYIKATKVLSNKIGYESLDGQPIEFRVKEQSGSWNDVAHFYPTDQVQGDVFMARVIHNAPSGGSYAYAVTPSVASDDFYNRAPLTENFEIIKNDSTAAIVKSKSDNVIMAVFWQQCSDQPSVFSTFESIEPSVAIARQDSTGEYKVEFTKLK